MPYPSEVWPADATAVSLDGTTDQPTGLPYLAKGTGPNSVPTLQVQDNRRQQRLNKVLDPINQGRVVDEGGLNVGVYPIRYFNHLADETYFAGQTGFAVTNNATRYLWLDQANTLQQGAAFPVDPTDYLPLAKVITSGGDITSIEDYRSLSLWQVNTWNPGPGFARSGNNDDITELVGLTTPLTVAQGGTGANSAAGARTSLSAAKSGANSDLTSITGLTTALSVPQGGTGATSASAARTSLAAAASGANADITSLTGLTTPLSVAQGGTGSTTGAVVPFGPTLFFPGTQAVGVLKARYIAPVSFTLKLGRGSLYTAPTGDTFILDIRVNGSSIFANQTEMVRITAGSQNGASATKNHAVAAGDVVDLEVEQVGSGTAGADLTVVIDGRATLGS